MAVFYAAAISLSLFCMTIWKITVYINYAHSLSEAACFGTFWEAIHFLVDSYLSCTTILKLDDIMYFIVAYKAVCQLLQYHLWWSIYLTILFICLTVFNSRFWNLISACLATQFVQKIGNAKRQFINASYKRWNRVSITDLDDPLTQIVTWVRPRSDLG